MNKSAKLVFFLENNCFQSHQSRQLSTNIRISAHLFCHEKTIKSGFCTGKFIQLKRQSENESKRQNYEIQ